MNFDTSLLAPAIAGVIAGAGAAIILATGKLSRLHAEHQVARAKAQAAGAAAAETLRQIHDWVPDPGTELVRSSLRHIVEVTR